MAQQRLGKGLGALLGDEAVTPQRAETDAKTSAYVTEIDVNEIDRVESQPRKSFDEEKLRELADSISTHGIVSPIIVNKKGSRYSIIAGERRYRAARLAGLTSVPCIIKDIDDREHVELSLIENLQREDLNAIEEAEAIRLLMDEYSLTQEEVSSRISKSRSAVANSLRLLNLPSDVRFMVSQGRISAGHARCLITLPDDLLKSKLAQEIEKKGLSVRDAERMAALILNPPQKKAKQKLPRQDEISYAEKNLSSALETKVSISGDTNRGRIVIEYYSYEQLDALYSYMTEKDREA